MRFTIHGEILNSYGTLQETGMKRTLRLREDDFRPDGAAALLLLGLREKFCFEVVPRPDHVQLLLLLCVVRVGHFVLMTRLFRRCKNAEAQEELGDHLGRHDVCLVHKGPAF